MGQGGNVTIPLWRVFFGAVPEETMSSTLSDLIPLGVSWLTVTRREGPPPGLSKDRTDLPPATLMLDIFCEV